MSNDNQDDKKGSAVVDDEVRIYAEAERNSQDPAKDNGSRNRFLDGLREHPLKVALVVLALLAIVIVIGYLVRNAFLYEDTDDAQIDGDIYAVTSRINGVVPMEVDWQLNPTNNGYKVTNLFVGGINMASLQHSEMVSVIQRNSGQMQALLAALREKNSSNGIVR